MSKASHTYRISQTFHSHFAKNDTTAKTAQNDLSTLLAFCTIFFFFVPDIHFSYFAFHGYFANIFAKHTMKYETLHFSYFMRISCFINAAKKETAKSFDFSCECWLWREMLWNAKSKHWWKCEESDAKYPSIQCSFFAFQNRFHIFCDKCIADLVEGSTVFHKIPLTFCTKTALLCKMAQNMNCKKLTSRITRNKTKNPLHTCRVSCFGSILWLFRNNVQNLPKLEITNSTKLQTFSFFSKIF